MFYLLFLRSRSLLNYFSVSAPNAQYGLVSFIEQQIESSKVLGLSKDYRYWVLNLVQHLVSMHSSGFGTDNIEARLRDLCHFLLGQQFPTSRKVESVISASTPLPSRINSSSSGAGSTTSALVTGGGKVVGLSKHELLREILSILASNLLLQRLYTEFKEQLDSFSPSVSFTSTYFNSTRTKTPLDETHMLNDGATTA